MQYVKHVAESGIPQTEPIPGEPQVKNEAGGYVYETTIWQRLERFLILGSEGGTYYASERRLTQENAAVVRECLTADPERTVGLIVDVSDGGRTPKNDPAVFALALAASGDPEARKLALTALPRVCRIPTHLFQFVGACDELRGWGRGLRRAVGRWYTEKTPDALAYALAKYQSRGGWSNRDVLRLAKPRATGATGAAFQWAVGKGLSEAAPRILEGVEKAKEAKPKVVAKLISEYGLTREMVPTESLDSPEVWAALLEKMPMTAMIRNLGKMSAVGLLRPLSSAAKTISARLSDRDAIRKARVHPLALLIAAKTYGQGRGLRGSLSWEPVGPVTDALEMAFYLAFDNVAPTGKNHLLAIDVSGSMGWGNIAGTPITPREGAAVMALVTSKAEPNYQIMAYSDQLVPVDFSGVDSLRHALQVLGGIPMGGTDCALPLLYARQNRLDVDAFVSYTDSETWAGAVHYDVALREYRKSFVPDARSIVVGMTSNGFTLNHPEDPHGMDVVGFDAAAPAVMAAFILCSGLTIPEFGGVVKDGSRTEIPANNFSNLENVRR